MRLQNFTRNEATCDCMQLQRISTSPVSSALVARKTFSAEDVVAGVPRATEPLRKVLFSVVTSDSEFFLQAFTCAPYDR